MEDERANTPEGVEQLIRSKGFPSALHTDGPAEKIDRFYVLNEEHLQQQIERALEAAKKNNADGVLVLPFPNSRQMSARSL